MKKETVIQNMDSEEYDKLLSKAPDHNSDEFIDFLKENNIVVWENLHWLIIENCKYNGWRTAFAKTDFPERNLYEVLEQYPECEWRKKSAKKQTIKRFHIHIIADK